MKNYGTRLNPQYYCCWSRDTDVDSKQLLCSSIEGLLLSRQHALKDLAEQLLINVPGWVLTVDLVLKCPKSDKHLHPELHALLNGDALLAHDERQVRGPEPLCDPVPVPERNLVNRPAQSMSCGGYPPCPTCLLGAGPRSILPLSCIHREEAVKIELGPGQRQPEKWSGSSAEQIAMELVFRIFDLDQTLDRRLREGRSVELTTN
ncbi:hypothetical protein B0H14DRAFT_2603843 [Mycena olivaceomarginata]|nr:hypothetical protein B0H14DRAFT_2603843 [Mycena olivaceomarginata]